MKEFEVTIKGVIYFGKYDVRNGNVELSEVTFNDDEGEEFNVTGRELLQDIKHEVEDAYEDDIEEERVNEGWEQKFERADDLRD